MTFPLKHISRHVALEMIDIQDSSFGQQLEKTVESIRIGILQGDYNTYEAVMRSGHIKTIEQQIFARTGLRVETIISQDPAAILSFFINKHSIFIKPYFRGMDFNIKEQQEIIDKAHDKKGSVDLKKAKVSGIFSEYNNKLFINFHALINEYRLSSQEIVAIILHELGHAFYMCEFSDRLETTNQVLANVAKELLSKKEKNLTYIYKELKSIDDTVTDKTIDDIVNGNGVIAGYKLFRTILNSVISQVADAKYDETSFEQLADHFPSKFGYGRPLITALDKMHIYFDNPEKSESYNTFNFITSTMQLLFTAMLLIGAIISGPIMSVFAVLYISILMRILGEDMKDYTYDQLKVRYKRIRHVYIDSIKKLDISKDELKSILDNIYAIDNIINNTHINVTLFEKLSNMIFSKANKAEKSIREQQLLEDLAFNDLFLKSAEFKTL